MKKHILSILLVAAVAAGGLAGCKSPLEADGPRTRTPLTPAPRITPSSIEWSLITPNGDYEWDGTATIQFDTVVQPARVWMDIRMVEVSGDTTVLIKRYSIKVDSMESDDAITLISTPEAYMWYDAKDGGGVLQRQCDPYTNTVGVVCTLTNPDQGSQKDWSIRIYLGANLTHAYPNIGSDQVLGEIRVRL